MPRRSPGRSARPATSVACSTPAREGVTHLPQGPGRGRSRRGEHLGLRTPRGPPSASGRRGHCDSVALLDPRRPRVVPRRRDDAAAVRGGAVQHRCAPAPRRRSPSSPRRPRARAGSRGRRCARASTPRSAASCSRCRRAWTRTTATTWPSSASAPGEFERGMIVTHASTGRPFATKYALSVFGRDARDHRDGLPGRHRRPGQRQQPGGRRHALRPRRDRPCTSRRCPPSLPSTSSSPASPTPAAPSSSAGASRSSSRRASSRCSSPRPAVTGHRSSPPSVRCSSRSRLPDGARVQGTGADRAPGVHARPARLRGGHAAARRPPRVSSSSAARTAPRWSWCATSGPLRALQRAVPELVLDPLPAGSR